MSSPNRSATPGIKISLSGCFSSGKTTMLGILSHHFPEIVMYAELATATKTTCPGLDWRSDDVRGYLRWAQVMVERQHEQAGGVGIFDGSYADLVAHERLFGSRFAPVPETAEPLPYALALVCDPDGVPLEINGIRETDSELRRDLHVLVREEVLRRSARVVDLRGTLEDRTATAIDAVEALLRQHSAA